MKRSVWIKYLLLILCMILLASQLSGCGLLPYIFAEAIVILSDALKEEAPTIQNPIDFQELNVLVVTVSETSWFVLCNAEGQNGQGRGEWLVDGISIPILFEVESHDEEKKLWGNLLISYDYGEYDYHTEGNDKRPASNESIYIAKISNDPEDPWLRWCIGGHYFYSPKYAEEQIPVTYHQYRREEAFNDSWNLDYVPLSQSPFYTIPDGMTVRYREKTLDFYFDGRTGEGIWTVGETQYPVLCTFDIGRFTFTMCYNTEDEKKGQMILTAEGTRLGEVNTAYRITDYADEFTGDPSAELVLLKNYVSPSDAWTDFTSAEDGIHTVFRCEKGNFFYDATAKEGTWITNGTEIPIRIEFDPLRYEMNVFDVSTGEKILNAKGYLQDDHTAVFTEYEGSMFYKNSLGDIVIEKNDPNTETDTETDTDTGTDTETDPDTGTDVDPDTGTDTETATQE